MPERLDFIDGLRGIAILGVVAFHVVILADPNLGGIALHLPAAAVAIFFVISGFCLMWPFLTDDGSVRPMHIRAFFLRRWWRTFPPYLLALVACVLASGVVHQLSASGWRGRQLQNVWGSEAPDLAGNLISHLTMTHGFVPEYTLGIDGAFWYLATEWQFIFVFPLVLLLARRFGVGCASACLVSTWIFYVGFGHFFAHRLVDAYGGLLPIQLIHFAVGIYCAALIRRRQAIPHIGLVAAGLALVAWVSVGAFPAVSRPLFIALAYGSVLLAANTGGLAKRVGTNRLLSQVGRLSYSLYLAHGTALVLVALVVSYLQPGLLGRCLALSVVGVPLAFWCATQLSRRVERPSWIFSQRWLERGDAPTSPRPATGELEPAVEDVAPSRRPRVLRRSGAPA